MTKKYLSTVIAAVLAGTISAAGAAQTGTPESAKAPEVKTATAQEQNMSIFEKLNGSKLDVVYESGIHYRMTYLSDKELQWEALSEVANGDAKTGVEPYWFYRISDNIYNINWIEKDGMTASQILDFNTSSVYVFLTWEDASERGGRGQVLQKGTFKLVK